VQIKQRILAILATFTFFGMAPAAFAEIKLAVVDVQSAILNSESAKKITTQIQSEFTREQESIKKLQTDAAVLLERLQKDGEVMSDAEKRKVQQEIESINNDFVYERQKLQRAIEERQKELFAGIDQRVQSAINELVLSDDYDIILPRQAALYVGDLYDITRKVTEKLNMLDAKN
jgi:outer membrane protein